MEKKEEKRKMRLAKTDDFRKNIYKSYWRQLRRQKDKGDDLRKSISKMLIQEKLIKMARELIATNSMTSEKMAVVLENLDDTTRIWYALREDIQKSCDFSVV